MAISVAVAVGDVGDKLIPKLVERARALKVKDGMELDAEMGPIVTAAAHARISGYIAQGVRKAPRLVVATFQGASAGEGCAGFLDGGTLFDQVTPDMRIYKEEIFGPVLVCVRVPDFADRGATWSTTTNSAMVSAVSPATATCAGVQPPHPGRHGRHQRADPGAHGLARLRRLETQPVRRHACLRRRRRALCHEAEEHHAALADGIQVPRWEVRNLINSLVCWKGKS